MQVGPPPAEPSCPECHDGERRDRSTFAASKFGGNSANLGIWIIMFIALLLMNEGGAQSGGEGPGQGFGQGHGRISGPGHGNGRGVQEPSPVSMKWTWSSQMGTRRIWLTMKLSCNSSQQSL